MSWSGGSYTKGNAATGGWAGDASLGIGIEAGRHDTQDNDFATGINNCLAKDGQNAMTANINLGGYVPTNVGAGTAAAPAYCAGNDSNTGMFSAAADNIGFATNGSERVRIDNTGKVGIGTTSPTNALDVRGNISSASQTPSGSVNLEISQYSNDSAGPTFQTIKSRGASVGTAGAVTSGDSLFVQQIYGNHGSGNARAAYIQAIVDSGTVSSTSMPGALIFATTPNGSTTTTERMRIDNGGNVGIGVSSFGNIRTTIRGVDSTSSNFAFFCDNSSASELFVVRNDGQFRTGVAASSPYNNTTGSAPNVFVTSGGILQRQSSSAKYKTDIVNYTHGLEAVNALRPVFYKNINDGDKQFAGLIAEEVHEAGLHEFVVYNENNEPDALHYGNMVALAFKAIQELNAKVEALEARIAELEA